MAQCVPHQAFARGMKLSKEDVIGVLAALEVWFEHRDPAVELARWNADVATIAARIDLPGVTTEVIAPRGVVRVPRLRVLWDAAKFAIDSETLRQRLLDGEPRIMLDDMSAKPNSVDVDPFGLQPGEAEQVGRAIAAALAAPAQAAKPAPSVPSVDVSGEWDLGVSFTRGERTHRVRLRQQDGVITGSQSSHQFEGPVGWMPTASTCCSARAMKARSSATNWTGRLRMAGCRARLRWEVQPITTRDRSTRRSSARPLPGRTQGECVMDGFSSRATNNGRAERLRMRQGLFTGPTSGLRPATCRQIS